MDTAELDQLVAQIGEEIIARLNPSGSPKAEGLNIPELVCPGCVQRCPQTCAEKTKEILAAGADRVSASDRLTGVDPAIAPRVDLTVLRPEATCDDVLRVCREACRCRFASVCVNPHWVPLAAHELAGTPVKLATVIGFPLGATTTDGKVAETLTALRVGAQEIDMVINLGALCSGDYDTVKRDIQAVVKETHDARAIVQVILETGFLNDTQKAIACTVARMAGADFVKTSSGFGPSGATTHDVALMRRVVGPDAGIKAPGASNELEDLRRMKTTGATRIGASASVRIVEATAA